MTPPDYLIFCDRRAKSTLSSKQRISLFTNFPLHVNEGKLVDKLNYHVGNLEGNKYEVYIPWEKKESVAIMVLPIIIFGIYTRY